MRSDNGKPPQESELPGGVADTERSGDDMTKHKGGQMKCSAGGLGWLGLGIYVAAWDAWALRRRHETLSSAFGRSISHPRSLPFVALGWGLLTAHLFGRPQAFRRLDPIAAVARRVERKGVLA